MKNKRFLSLLLSMAMLATMVSVFAVDAAAATVSVTTATVTSSQKLSSLSEPSGGLFCGWYTTETGARNLDGAYAAKDGFAGTVYGATLSISGKISVVGVQMRTEEPTGIRFLSKIDKDIISTVESLNVLNRQGKNGTLTPANENKKDIGYGTVLAIDVEHKAAFSKLEGETVRDGMCVPGCYTYSEDATSITYTATVIGVDMASVADKIAARPYITYVDANGTRRTELYSESGSANGAYAASVYEVATLVNNDSSATAEAKTTASKLLSDYTGTSYYSGIKNIDQLNKVSSPGSADDDNAYIEFDRSTLVQLYKTGAITNDYRWRTCFYPRVTKIRDDLYLMTIQYEQEGQHIYYSLSTDKGKNWTVPELMYNANDAHNKITIPSGSLAGTVDTFYAATADHCLLNDGKTILCVYSRRPCIAYSLQEYTNMSSLELVKGTVNGNTITWSEPRSIYYGQNWEAEIIQRENGQIDIYWTHIAPMLYLYGFQDTMRSSGVAMISSTDGGNTWTPNVTASSTTFAAKRVFQMSAGNVTVNGKAIPFMHCQMPGVVELVNGKMMVVAEARPVDRDTHKISKGYSEAGGVWKELGISEQGPSNHAFEVFTGAAPTLMRFESGEVLMTYNKSSMLYGRLMNKTGTNMTAAHEYNIFDTTTTEAGGFWSMSEPLDSHTAMVGMTYKRFFGREPYPDEETGVEMLQNTTVLGKVRLNHTINATKKNMVADGNLQEWANVDQALFIGSLSATTQASFRFAYDDDYIYVAVDRIDDSNNKDDTNVVRIATANGYVEAVMTYNSATTSLPAGVTAGTKTAGGGRVYEFAFDRAALGLTGDFIRVNPGIADMGDDGVLGAEDRISRAASLNDTSTWIKINLK